MRDALIRTVWYGEGFDALMGRALLTPFEWLYGAASMLVGALRARNAGRSAVPTISIGNLTVGGTGKTPVAAWCAAQLAARGRATALLMRGYGDDEPLVHARLNPGVPVFADPDRRRAAQQAVAKGARALVLDDGFQHRQMPRDADVVVVSADLWSDLPPRLLPAGPFREPLLALRRAHLVIVTRKAATRERAAVVADAVRRAAPHVPVAVALLAPDALCAWESERREPLNALDGERVLAVAGIGAPEAFTAQLTAAGAYVESVAFGDHHVYTASDAAALALRARTADRVVCTLKDAVKLGTLWPAEGPPLWYLSQSVVFESGAARVEAVIDGVLRAAAPLTPA